MTKTLRRVRLGRLALIVYCVDLAVFLVTALPLGALATLTARLAAPDRPNPNGPLWMACLMLLIHPVAAAALAAIAGFFYNKIAARTGGLEFEIE